MEITCEQFWPMLREIRVYCQETGHRVVAIDNPMKLTLGFWTLDAAGTSAERKWVISLSRLRFTGTVFDCELDGSPLKPESPQVLRRYLRLMGLIDGRKIVAEALSVGVHPSDEIVARVTGAPIPHHVAC